jgi:hypothetical protein
VQDVILIPQRSSPTDNDNVKRAVLAYGAVFITIFYDDANYNAGSKSYNYMPAASDKLKSPNHAVAVVGWDDNFDRNRFTNPPSGNGAFILRNSWGTSWGEAGYFYLSYYDAVAGIVDPMNSFDGIEVTSNWTRVYQYDELGWIKSYGGSSDTAWFANVFTAQDAESIGAAAFYAATPNAPYSISVYTGVQDVPTSGSLAGTTTGTILTAGYHTIPLATPVSVTAGSRFAVVVRLQTPGFKYPVPVELAVSGESSAAASHPGESYTSGDGSSWSDLTKWDATANVCLKAFSNKAGSGNVSVTIASNPPGQTITVDGTPYSSAKLFTWATGSNHTVNAGSPQGSGATRYVFANWSDGGAQSHSLNITQAGTFTANFTTQYLLTTSASPTAGGSVAPSPNPADHYYNGGTSVQVTATAASGYAFDSWSTGLSGAANPATITLSQPLTVTAVFRTAAATTIATSPAGLNVVVDGATYAAPHSFNWTVNSTHTVNATSPQGTGTRYAFSKWSDNGNQSHTLTVTAGGATFTATYNPQYLLTAQTTPSGSGSVTATPSSTDGYYAAGTAVALKAVAAGGFTFSQWTGALSGATNPQSVTMSGPRTVTAAFGAASSGMANDEIPGAAAIGSLPYKGSQGTRGASSNKTDPTHSCTGSQDARTVWFNFVPSFTGVANISTLGSDYDTVLSTYSGVTGDELACSDDANELTNTSLLALGVTKGQAVIIEVSAYGSTGIGGNLVLNITGQALALAPNDEIPNSGKISGLPSNVSEITRTATTNSTDPYHSCTGAQDGNSVWFFYVATYTGRIRVNTIGSDYDTVLTGYSGITGDELACNDDIDDSTTASEIEFRVTKGLTYYFEVTSWNGGSGGLLVLNSMPLDVPPVNDEIDSALGIPTLPYTIQEDTVDATEADYDPVHSCTGDWDLRTVWFWYTATFTGSLRMNTFGSEYDTVLSVYDGDTGYELACNDDAADDTFQSAISLNVTAGKTYWIEVSEYDDPDWAAAAGCS